MRQKDLEARARSAGAFAAIFTAVAGASFAGALPRSITVIAGCVALAALIAVWRFYVEAREAGARLATAIRDRERSELLSGAPVSAVERIDPTQIGVDPAAQDILPGGEIPEYVPRDVDDDLREALKAALDGSGRWLVVVHGPSKVGKSRTLFEAVVDCARHCRLEIVAPVDANGLRMSVASLSEPTQPSARRVLWLDDLEPFLNSGVTLATLRDWRASAHGGIVVATYGGKGSERVAGSATGGLATIASEVLQSAREIPLEATTSHELAVLSPRVSAERFATIERHGLAAYLVAAPALERKLVTRRHAPGEAECPEGAAVVLAAVDWARCGRTDPISHDTLHGLWRGYLPGGSQASDQAFDAAITWATRPVAGTIALLQPSGGYQAFDYIVRLVREKHDVAPAPDTAWAAALATAVDAQALAVATTAYLQGRSAIAHDALVRARASLSRRARRARGRQPRRRLGRAGSLRGGCRRLRRGARAVR